MDILNANLVQFVLNKMNVNVYLIVLMMVNVFKRKQQDNGIQINVDLIKLNAILFMKKVSEK